LDNTTEFHDTYNYSNICIYLDNIHSILRFNIHSLYAVGMEPCIDFTSFAPNNVAEHLKIDLDMQSVITNVKKADPAVQTDLDLAFDAYSIGNDLHLHYTFFI
jgi:hypothetical protein